MKNTRNSLTKKEDTTATTATAASQTQIGGQHYTSKAVQPWDAMQAWMTPAAFIGYLHGNATSNTWRAGQTKAALKTCAKPATTSTS